MNEIKNCKTCAHRDGGICVLAGTLWKFQRMYPDYICDEELSSWQAIPPKPPRRSLRKWIMDLLWN